MFHDIVFRSSAETFLQLPIIKKPVNRVLCRKRNTLFNSQGCDEFWVQIQKPPTYLFLSLEQCFLAYESPELSRCVARLWRKYFKIIQNTFEPTKIFSGPREIKNFLMCRDRKKV